MALIDFGLMYIIAIPTLFWLGVEFRGGWQGGLFCVSFVLGITTLVVVLSILLCLATGWVLLWLT